MMDLRFSHTLCLYIICKIEINLGFRDSSFMNYNIKGMPKYKKVVIKKRTSDFRNSNLMIG